ncbi:hypothetical protein SPOG_02217 [Schizosaccharomyces cryophilus OY26]|uniref:Uncharacterized protein n=1 Tax=Schizosaccharomyces cryophilus (strain OY26 / ATCC MYA-4695 / CBS 11777 / NBRC 106824 / NRRL Y48691) TaxID=653667 RepID=S9X1Q6_SCHCR|nr:uncharacterized protein SPOG_02217 [Schizosaccharomyces cryophilus OY26]EPY51037.1 hypothetical protein SPOG_02217 [Schizosaccharomyces cryophilus OY26]
MFLFSKKGLISLLLCTFSSLIQARDNSLFLYQPRVYPDLIDYQSFQLAVYCKRVNADENHPKYSSIQTYERIGGGMAVAYFPMEEWELVLGNSGLEKDCLNELYHKNWDFFLFEYICPEKRDIWTGPFSYSSDSIRTFSFPSNITHPNQFFEVEEKHRGTFCLATKPLSKKGSPSIPYVQMGYNSSQEPLFTEVYTKDALYYAPLIFTFGSLLFSLYWICAMYSQRSKILPIQYGLLVLILSSVFGLPFFFWWKKSCNYNYLGFFVPWHVLDIKQAFDSFIERLLLLFVSFGFGVWRPIHRKLILGMTLVLLFPFAYHSILKMLHWKTKLSETALDSIDTFLNDSSFSLVGLTTLYLNRTLTSTPYIKSKESLRVAKQSLYYCVALFLILTFAKSYFGYVEIFRKTFLSDSFICWTFRYVTKILIPCYIWHPSKNKWILYHKEEDKDYLKLKIGSFPANFGYPET